MRNFQAEDKEARTSESVGVSSTDALNYSLMCTYRVAYFSRMSAWAVRALAEVHFQNDFSKHEEGPSRDQTVHRFMSFPALGSDHRTASCEYNPSRLPMGLSACSRHKAVFQHPLTIFPLPHFFFLRFSQLHFHQLYHQRPSGHRCLYKRRDLLCRRSRLIPP